MSSVLRESSSPFRTLQERKKERKKERADTSEKEEMRKKFYLENPGIYHSGQINVKWSIILKQISEAFELEWTGLG